MMALVVFAAVGAGVAYSAEDIMRYLKIRRM